MEILAIVGSPQKGGRSVTAARAVLGGAAELDSHVSLLELASSPAPEAVQQAMQASDAIVFASPTYRARCSAQLKLLLEQTERGFYSETTSPLQGKAAAIVATGASPHHFLAVDDLRSVLAGFFAVQVLSPGLYFSPDAFLDSHQLTPDAAGIAAAHGRALVDLAAAVRASGSLQALRPLI
jgi:FMN reductase